MLITAGELLNLRINKMRNSQYLEDYLSLNNALGRGKGLTIGTYLAYELRGRAKNYSGRYARALENSLERNGAQKGRSFMGKVAYYES